MNRSPEKTAAVVAMAGIGAVTTGSVFFNRGGVDPNLVFYMVGALFLALAVWGMVRRYQNGRAVERFARRHGWTYQRSTLAPAGRFHHSPFGRGHSRRYSHYAEGEFGGARCSTFTYEFVTGSGKNRTNHLYTVDTVELPAWLPHLELVPEGVGAKLAKVFGAGDVDVESEEFNSRWRVKSADQRYAHAVLHPRMVELLLRPEAEGVALSIDGTAIVGWYVGTRGPENLASRLSTLAGFGRRIPEHVWRQYGGAHRGPAR